MPTWNESEHPRDEEGKFTYKNGGASNSNSNSNSSSSSSSDSNSTPMFYLSAEYNKEEENREDILYKDTTIKEKLLNYRNKLVDFLGDNLDRAEILFSTASELESKILNNAIESVVTTKERLVNSVNNLSKNDFKSEEEFKSLVNKAQKNYDSLKQIEQKTNSMFKINQNNKQEVLGEETIKNVLGYKQAIEKESNEIVMIAENIAKQKEKKGNKLIGEKPINLGKLPKNEPVKYKKAEEPPISRIKSNSQINNQYKTKVDPSEVVADWIMPCEGRISSPYGWRIHPITKEKTYHHGIDIAAKINTPIYAPIDGIITFADYEGANGNCIRINHGNINGKIVTSTFIHLNQINVKKEQRVEKGQLIGLVGSTGRYSNGKPSSTGPHLHLSVYENKVPVNPFKYIKK